MLPRLWLVTMNGVIPPIGTMVVCSLLFWLVTAGSAVPVNIPVVTKLSARAAGTDNTTLCFADCRTTLKSVLLLVIKPTLRPKMKH